MGLPTGEVQTALIALYRNDTTLRGLLVGSASPTYSVFGMNSEPNPTPFPYLSVGIITGQMGTLRTMQLDGTDLFVQTSIFTRSGGFLQARGIAKQVYALTQQTILSLSGGFSNPLTLFDNYQELEEPDGITQHIPMRWHVMVQG